MFRREQAVRHQRGAKSCLHSRRWRTNRDAGPTRGGLGAHLAIKRRRLSAMRLAVFRLVVAIAPLSECRLSFPCKSPHFLKLCSNNFASPVCTNCSLPTHHASAGCHLATSLPTAHRQIIAFCVLARRKSKSGRGAISRPAIQTTYSTHYIS